MNDQSDFTNDQPGFGFTYNPGNANSEGGETSFPMAAQGGIGLAPDDLFAWQICLADPKTSSLEDADNYPEYAINRAAITQALGLGMAQGNNALPTADKFFVAAVSIQKDGEIVLINETYPRYGEIAAIVAEQLLRGEDHGMVAQMPNGNLVPFVPQSDPSQL